MKSNEARELMTARVQAAHAKWPEFGAMPEAKGDHYIPVNETLLEHHPAETYAKALYAAAYRGEPVGRSGMTIAVRKVAEPSLKDRPPPSGRRLQAGR
jgi:hypothetical protein